MQISFNEFQKICTEGRIAISFFGTPVLITENNIFDEYKGYENLKAFLENKIGIGIDSITSVVNGNLDTSYMIIKCK